MILILPPPQDTQTHTHKHNHHSGNPAPRMLQLSDVQDELPTYHFLYRLIFRLVKYTFVIEDAMRRGDAELPSMPQLVEGYKDQKVNFIDRYICMYYIERLIYMCPSISIHVCVCVCCSFDGGVYGSEGAVAGLIGGWVCVGGD